ncbi:TadE/TadG family type IV pilus assembly protein [Bradyrhizobium sp. HKCCYLS20291]|uniref:TadE/TadG family type IV pilus assembly protein n=1 Tax=Bradyrhizobium sp. HKCCYLS20291 TaxID=3420766 RepID=UPI003EB81117
MSRPFSWPRKPGQPLSRAAGIARRFHRDDRGVTAIEFAMLMPLFCVILFLIVQFGYRYYYISVLHEQTFALGQTIIPQSSRPANIAAAKSILTNNLSSSYGITASSYTLYVGQVTANSPTTSASATDYYAPQSAVPVLIRVVYPSKQLLDLSSMLSAWPALFGNKIDTSIVIVPK